MTCLAGRSKPGVIFAPPCVSSNEEVREREASVPFRSRAAADMLRLSAR
jgi:hypothetical protein